MNLRSKLIKEVGLEFWGLLSFEVSIQQLYRLFNELLKDFGVSMRTFQNWVLFPEWIPEDYLVRIGQFLKHIRERDTLLNCTHKEELESEEHLKVAELLRVKYGSDYLDPKQFTQLYHMPSQALESFFKSLYLYGYITPESLLRYTFSIMESKLEQNT